MRYDLSPLLKLKNTTMPSTFTANNADKYQLYQYSVQSADVDAEFLYDTYQEERGYAPKHLREDFCGTCLLSAHWLQLNNDTSVEAYDIDSEPLSWGLEHNLLPLGEIASHCQQFNADAREPSSFSPDVRCAQNFSYWVFKTRQEMLEYFTGAYHDLADDGIFVIDLHGGPDSCLEQEEETDIEEHNFTYVWDQHHYHPINNQASLSIHFRFPDGTELTDAFTYEWRIWGLAELRDILHDAGFQQVDCYWEGTAEDGESGNGIFTKETMGEARPAYVAYLVGVK